MRILHLHASKMSLARVYHSLLIIQGFVSSSNHKLRGRSMAEIMRLPKRGPHCPWSLLMGSKCDCAVVNNSSCSFGHQMIKRWSLIESSHWVGVNKFPFMFIIIEGTKGNLCVLFQNKLEVARWSRAVCMRTWKSTLIVIIAVLHCAGGVCKRMLLKTSLKIARNSLDEV